MKKLTKGVAVALVAALLGISAIGCNTTTFNTSSAASALPVTASSTDSEALNIPTGIDPAEWTTYLEDYPDKAGNHIAMSDITSYADEITEADGGKSIAFQIKGTSSSDQNSQTIEIHYLPPESDYSSISSIAYDYVSFCKKMMDKSSEWTSLYGAFTIYSIYLGRYNIANINFMSMEGVYLPNSIFKSNNSELNSALQQEYNTQFAEYINSESSSEEQQNASSEFNPSDYQTPNYEDLARNPKKHIGDKVKLTGSVIQVIEGDSSNELLLSLDGDYTEVLMVTYFTNENESRILEDDNVTVYGMMNALYTYTTVANEQKTIPSLFGEKIFILSHDGK